MRPDPRRLLGRPSRYTRFLRLFNDLEHRRRYVESVVGVRAGDRVLDLGCGTAEIARALPAVRYVGVDIDESSIEQARQIAGPGTSLLIGSFDDRRVIESGPYDVVMANGLLHHLPDDDVVRVFEVAREVSRAGARIVSCDGCFAPGQGLVRRALLIADRGRHVRTRDEYEALARRVFPEAAAATRQDLSRTPYTYCVVRAIRP